MLLFLMLAHAPLQIQGPWKYIQTGAAGWSANAFGVDDPSVPLSAGMNQPSLTWLTSSLLYAAQSRFGDEGVAQLAAVVLFFAYLLWARCFFLLSGSKFVATGATWILFATTNWYFGNAGPLSFSFLCAAILAWLLLGSIRRTSLRDNLNDDNLRVKSKLRSELGSPHLWWAVPLLMVFWCNLSGTFLIGILMLFALAVDCAFDSARSHGHVAGFWKSRRFHQSVFLLQLSIAATCLHPLGLKIWAAVLAPEQNPFWLAAGGSADLQLTNILGFQLAVGAGLTLWAFRNSRLRIAVADVVTIVLLLIPIVFNARLFAWLSPMFQLFIVSHLARRKVSAAERKQDDPTRASSHSVKPSPQNGEHRPLKFAYSLVCLLLIWMGFAFSPVSVPLLGGQARSAARMYAGDAPWEATEFLAKNPATGLVWAPSYWSEWIQCKADPNAQFFTSSNLAVMPAQVQRDYQRVLVGDATWESTLGRYAVETLVIDKESQDRLFNIVMREGKDWRIVFESDAVCVLRKKEVSI